MMKIVVNLKLKRRVKHTSAKHPRYTGCGKTPNVWRKGEICGMENNQSSLADRSWGILARSILHPFREIEFFRSLYSPERNGQARIVGGCPVCSQMFSLCRAKRSVEPPCALSSTRQPASRKKGNASPQLQPKPKRNLSLHTLR